MDVLDYALKNYARVIKQDLGVDIAEMPGAGAAGGLGAGLAAFLNAKLCSGIDMVLDAARFDEVIADSDLIITGEGKIDEQTAYGKTIGGILKRAHRHNIPVVAVAGFVSGEIQALYDAGLVAAFSIVPGPVSLKYAMENAAELLEKVCANVVRVKYLP